MSPALVNRLQELYPNSNHVCRLGLDRIPDTEVWEYARQEDFLVVTKDADFIDICSLRGFPLKIVPEADESQEETQTSFSESIA